MNPKTTLVLLLFAAIVGALLWFLGPEEKEPQTFRRLFPALDRDDVSEMELGLRSGQRVRILRAGASRFDIAIESESLKIEDRANDVRVRELVGYLETAMCETVRENPSSEDLEAFDLQPGKMFLQFTTREGSHELRFGADDATGGSCFMRLDGEGAVLRTGKNFKNALEFNAMHFRFERVFTFPNIAIDSMEIQRPITREEPEGARIELRKGPLGWRVEGDFEGRASSSKAAATINAFSQLRIESFASLDPEPREIENLGLDNPTVVTLSSGQAIESVFFGHLPIPDDPTDLVFFQREPGGEIFAVEGGRVLALLSDPREYRDRRLLRPLAQSTTSLTATWGGEVRYKIERAGLDRFVLTAPEKQDLEREDTEETIHWLLTRLERAEAMDFLDTDDFVAAGGTIESHQGSLEVRWRERNAPVWVTLGFYRLESGETERLLITRDDEADTYYEVEPTLLEVLSVHPVQLRLRQLVPREEEWTDAFDQATLAVGDRTLEILRGGGGYWEATEDSRRKTLKLQQFISSLVVRRAVRISPASDEIRPPWPNPPADTGVRRARLEMTGPDVEPVVFELYGEVEGGHLLRADSFWPVGSWVVVDSEMARDFVGAIEE